MSYTLILRPLATGGELAHEILVKDAQAMVEAGTAELTFDGIYRELKVAKPAKPAKPAKKVDAEYETKDMTPKGRSKKG